MEEEARPALPGATVVRVEGGVEIEGDAPDVARANLFLRLPTRVLLRLGTFEARDWKKLRRGVLGLPLSSVLPKGASVTIKAAASRSRLYHTGAIVERVAEALEEATAAVQGSGPDALSIFVRAEDDRITVSIDTSGERLHLRGWRTEGGDAPLRETLAAALVAIGRHRPDEPLLDPMCGSGTIVVEAAQRAIGRAPGLDRRFAFERFAGFDATSWRALRDRARDAERPVAQALVGTDIDEAQLAIAARNAERAGVTAYVRWGRTSLGSAKPHAPTGLVITNPPYGLRVGARDTSLPALYETLARTLRGPFASWRAAVLVEDRALLEKIGADPRRAVALKNGGLRVWAGLRSPTRAL